MSEIKSSGDTLLYKFVNPFGNRAIQIKIEKLLDAIQENPYKGIGKPEPLKHNLSGAWSRRITQEHRLVYEVNDKNEIVTLDILSLKGHY